MPKEKSVFLLIKIFGIVFLMANVSDARAEGPVWAGILRMNGIILPISTYVDGNWHNSWQPDIYSRNPPDPIPLEEIPNSWIAGSQQIPKNWRLPDYGDEMLTLKSIHAERYGVITGGKYWGLQTGYSDTRHNPVRFADRGIVLAGSAAMAFQAKPIALDSDIARTIMEYLESDFNTTEQKNILSERKPYDKYLPETIEDRRKKDLTVESFFNITTKEPTQNIFFISLSRRYPFRDKGFRNECYQGYIYFCWVLADAKGYRTLDSFMVYEDCVIKGGSLREIPIGLIIIENNQYVVSRMLESEGTRIKIRQIDKDNAPVVFRKFL